MNDNSKLTVRLPLTILIITNRCDDRFIRALASTQFADEVLIFDNDSGNNWQRLAKDYHFTVLPLPGEITDFAHTRNQALAKARYGWVLFLDSDEYLPPDTSKKIAKVLRDNLYEGLLIKRTDIFLGKPILYGEAGNVRLIRLARKRQLRFSGKIHEVPHLPGSIGDSDIEIIHESHTSISEFISDVAGYARVAASQRRTGRLRTLFELATFPLGKFLWGFLAQGGLRDGWRGFTYAVVMSLHSLFVRIYRLEALNAATTP